MSVEIELSVDGRSVLVDIEPNTLQALKNEFNDYCDEDEALKLRRQSWAPTFSMYGNDNALKEVKRKHLFTGGEKVVVQWTSLQLEVPKEHEAHQKPLVVKDKEADSAELAIKKPDCGKTILLKKVTTDKGKDPKLLIKKPETSSNEGNHSKAGPSKEEKYCENEISDSDDSDYGLLKEYVTDKTWKKLPQYIKRREMNRFELHEEKLKNGLITGPFEFDVCATGYDGSSSSSSLPSPCKTRNESTNRKRKVVTSDSDSSASKFSDHDDRHNETSSSSNNERSSERVLRQHNRLSKPSTSRAQPSTFSTSSDIQKMKPHLPRYDIPKILKKLEERGNDTVKEGVQNLNENGIVTGKKRQLLIRILVRYLFFKIAKDPKQATPDMREGLAKSIVLDYPKFQDSCDGKTTYPWNSLFDRQGRGWIANAARAIQKKYRTKRSGKKPKKDSSHTGQSENDKISDTEVQALALLMPGRAEKGEILDGMKKTFSLRQAARRRQDSAREILQKFPHLANYDGEILQEEFKRLRPNAQDMTLNFQKKMANILALGTPDRVTLPLENDVFKALLIMAKKLPRDMRKKFDPKGKSTTADFHDIVEIVQLGQDIDAFVSEKVTDANGPIQPYLVLVKSPVRNSIVKCFLILDQKPVQLSTTSILKSLEFLLKSYFIFNVNYPLGWRGVFHCLATCFANVFEDQDQGSRKRPDSINPSERDFMNSIKDPSE